MAEPLSIAGVATGAISLGLQVAGGLIDYLDAVKGRSEDLRSAKQQATQIRDLFSRIQDILPQLERDWPESATIVKRHVISCRAELGAFQALLSELSQPSPSSSGLRSRIAETKKKLSYPFERSKISRLEERLERVNSTLHTALQVTDLDASMATASEMRELRAVSMDSANQIREIHSLVVSLSQSQTSLRMQSAGASVSLTAVREISGATNRGTPLSLDSIQTAMSLASKPSLLSSSIKALEEFNTAQPSSRNISQVCLCRPSTKIAHHRKSWGGFLLLHQISSTRRHSHDCPLSQFDTDTQSSKFTAEYFGLGKLFQIAFAMSLESTRGAGGRSISPSFIYYPTVDERTAPAFRVISLVQDFISTNINRSEAYIRTVQRCFDTIFELYGKKMASPKDITSNGASLMHSIANVIGCCPPVIIDSSYPMVTNLVACGIPVTTYDEYGYTPAMNLLSCHTVENNIDSVIGVARLLLPEPDIPMVQREVLHWYKLRPLKGVLEEAGLAEASGCGPLSLAARTGDEELVQELIKKYPQSLEETNVFEHTPLHLALKHPPCLRLILEAGGSAMLMRNYSYSPLESACKLGYKASAQILLAAGSYISKECLEFCHDPWLDDLLITLKHRKDELKLLALEHLTQAEAKSFRLHEDKVLDDCALEVQQLLLERGICIPSRLCDFLGDPVYFLRCSVSTFDKLWALGFKDINCCNEFGNLPLTKFYRDVEKVRWLIEHGADYWTPFSDLNSRTNNSEIVATPAHFLSGRIGSRMKLGYSRRFTESDQWLFERFMQVQVSDACFCPCSKDGCTPLKALFDGHGDRGYPVDIRNVAQWCMWLTRTFQASFSIQDLIATLRRVTFDVLQLMHTCCNFANAFYSYHKSLRTLEEVEEINSEQRPLLTLFENVLVGFNQVAREDQDGVPLIVHDPEEFWIRHWLPRMEEVLDDLDGDNLTAEEVSVAEAMGVKWDLQRDHKEQKEEVIEKDYWTKWTPEYVMGELKKIMDG